jgi:hypothetical protein
VLWSDDENSDSPMERMISLWFETAHGTFAMQLLDPDQKDPDRQLIASWQGGRRIDESLVRNLVPGKKYVVKLQAFDGARVYGVIGIKVLHSRCPSEIEGLALHPADPTRGYSWPYLLVPPSSPVVGTSRLPSARTRWVLVVPNNTGGATDDLQVVRAMAECALTDAYDIDAFDIAKKLGSPILVPLFPRPDLNEIASNLQIQALTRASLEDLPERLSRIDQQLIAMIDDAREKLADEGWPVRRRVLMAGFSAAGQFTNRFTLLHPERVLAAAVGGPGSWPIAPVAADLDHASDCLSSESGDAGRHHGCAFTKVMSQLVIQFADLFSLGRYRCLLNL